MPHSRSGSSGSQTGGDALTCISTVSANFMIQWGLEFAKFLLFVVTCLFLIPLCSTSINLAHCTVACDLFIWDICCIFILFFSHFLSLWTYSNISIFLCWCYHGFWKYNALFSELSFHFKRWEFPSQGYWLWLIRFCKTRYAAYRSTTFFS